MSLLSTRDRAHGRGGEDEETENPARVAARLPDLPSGPSQPGEAPPVWVPPSVYAKLSVLAGLHRHFDDLPEVAWQNISSPLDAGPAVQHLLNVVALCH